MGVGVSEREAKRLGSCEWSEAVDWKLERTSTSAAVGNLKWRWENGARGGLVVGTDWPRLMGGG
jgi:hypothetical protein